MTRSLISRRMTTPWRIVRRTRRIGDRGGDKEDGENAVYDDKSSSGEDVDGDGFQQYLAVCKSQAAIGEYRNVNNTTCCEWL